MKYRTYDEIFYGNTAHEQKGIGMGIRRIRIGFVTKFLYILYKYLMTAL